MTDAELAELERLAAEASPGPWFARDSTRHPEDWAAIATGGPVFDSPDCDFGWTIRVGDPDEGYSILHGENYHSQAEIRRDIDFIAAARDAVPALVEEVKRLREFARECGAMFEATRARFDPSERVWTTLDRLAGYARDVAGPPAPPATVEKPTEGGG